MNWAEFLILILVLELGVAAGFFIAAALASGKIADIEAELLEHKESKSGAREEEK